MNDADRLRFWNAASSHVRELHPPVAALIESIRERSWHPPVGEAAQVLMLRALLGPAAEALPHEAVQRLANALLHPTRSRSHLPPQILSMIEGIPGYDRNRLIDALQWAGRRSMAEELADLPTTEAIREVTRSTGLLRGYRAYAFLDSLGLSAVAPEPCHQTLLQRLGMMGELDREEPDVTFATLQRLSVLAKVPVREVALVLSVFAGGRGSDGAAAARCLPEPQCAQCPVAQLCAHARATSQVPPGGAPDSPTAHRLPIPANSGSDEEVLARALGIPDATLPPAVASLVRGPLRLHALYNVSEGELDGLAQDDPGLARRVVALGEILARARKFIPLPADEPIRNARQIWQRYRHTFQGLKHEELHVVLLDTGMRIIREALVSVGSLRECLADPRAIFHDAVRDRAFGVILLHNHPSGSCAPSPQDHLLTSRISRSGKILGIPLLDHVVFGSASHFSFKETGLLHELETDEDAGPEQ